MEQDYLVAVVAQRLNRPHDGCGVLIEIGEHDHNATPMEKVLEVKQRLGKVGAGMRLGLLQPSQQAIQLPLSRGGPDIVAYLIVKDNEAGRVPLVVDGEIEKRGGRKAGVIHLAGRLSPARGVVHRIAGVEQDGELAVGIAAIALEIAAFGAGKKIPIDMAQIVPRRVGAVLGELLAEAKIRRAMETGDEAIHHCPGEQVKARNAGQHGGI